MPRPTPSHRATTMVATAILLSLALLAAGCGSNGSNDRGSGSTGTTTAATGDDALGGMRSSRTAPMNCGITPSDPLTVTEPASGATSPVSRRSSVVLPAPFGPTERGRPPLADPERVRPPAATGHPAGSNRRAPPRRARHPRRLAQRVGDPPNVFAWSWGEGSNVWGCQGACGGWDLGDASWPRTPCAKNRRHSTMPVI